MHISDRIWRALKKARILPWHVFLLTFYAILSFLAVNQSQVNARVADRLLFYFSISVLVLLTITFFLTRDLARTGVYVFLVLFIFFNYMLVKNVLITIVPSIARHLILIPVFSIVFVFLFFLIRRQSSKRIRTLTIYLNIFGLILLAFPIYQIMAYDSRMTAYQTNLLVKMEEDPSTSYVPLDSAPDIYFIILDGYARADALDQVIGLDNTEFLDALRQTGFFVADCSMSNYTQTELSLASILNMNYLDEVFQQIPAEGRGEAFFSPYIKNSFIRRYFQGLDYQMISFFNGYHWAEWEDADYFLGDPRTQEDRDGLIPFEEQFLNTTFLRPLSDVYRFVVPASEMQEEILSEDESARSIVLYTLDILPTVAQLRSPKFVFVHLILPHPPYIFGPGGEEQFMPAFSDLETLYKGYHDQVLFANSRILPILDSLISQSDGNAIIILQGDHGLINYPEDWMRLAILNAYYFPNRDYSSLYPGITPVNTFRTILRQYFGEDYAPLADQSFFSSDSQDNTFELIQNTCPDQ